VTFFITKQTKKVFSISYLARATITGSFIALPAEVYAMYKPEIWGRTASQILVIGLAETVAELAPSPTPTPTPTPVTRDVDLP
jgi:hypothetical protein